MTFVPPHPVPNSSVTKYMRGTRRIDEMAANARQRAFQERYSYTEGWDDNTVGGLFNVGLNELYDKITEVDEVANIEEFTTTVFAGVQSYPIPQHVKMAQQIMNVRYLYGPETWQFVTLEQGMIQDRYSYPTNIPSTYCIRNGYLLLSPTPNITRENSLIVNYQKRMRSLDYRRGKVTNIISPFGNVVSITVVGSVVTVTTSTPHGLSNGNQVGLGGVFTPNELIDFAFFITVTSTTTFTLNNVNGTYFSTFTGTCLWYLCPVQFQLNFAITSQKDINLQANANSILDKVDWICFTDRNGERVIDAIPINNYNQSTFIVTCDPNYVIPYADWLNFQFMLSNQDIFYVVTGDYASTHSQLDRQAEDLLIEYVVLRLLRLQSAAEPTKNQLDAEEVILKRIAIAYRRYRPSVVPIIWQQRLRAKSYFYGGRGPY
jgi:hypothetical protein